MICTEQEAAEKWCPQAMMQDRAPWNRDHIHHNLGGPLCIGSRCMMWVWLDGNLNEEWIAPHQLASRLATGWHKIEHAENDEHSVLVARDFPLDQNRRGTCGLINAKEV